VGFAFFTRDEQNKGERLILTPEEQKKELLRRYFREIGGEGNLNAIPNFVSSAIVFWGLYSSEPLRGVKAFTE